MKTTVEVSDYLYRRAKAEAALRGRKLKDLVEEGLRLVLEARANASASEPVRADEGRTRSGRFWRSGPCLESRISHGLRPRCAPPSLIRVRWSLFSTGRNSITAGSPSGSRSWTRRFSCVSRC